MKNEKPTHRIPWKTVFLLLAATLLLSGCLKFEIQQNRDPLTTAPTEEPVVSETTEEPAAFETTSAIPETTTVPETLPETTESTTIDTTGVTFLRDEEGFDIPINDRMMTAYRKAHQLVKIQWTNLKKVPHPLNNKGLNGNTQTGMVYSSVKETEKYVPQDVSIRTFMTALNNPYSLMYTENVSGNWPASQYGFDYNGTNYCGAYYGAVCSSYSSYVLGLNALWGTAMIPYLAKTGVLEELADNSAAGVQLLDILLIYNSSGKTIHVVIVTDIYRDENGTPKRIYVSELTSPVGRTKNPETGNAYFTYDEFNTYWIKGKRKAFPDTRYPVVLYRCPALYQNDGCKPSAFDDDDIETALAEIVYNEDICTYAGDYAAFRTGFPIHINYEKGSYTHMVIVQDQIIAEIPLPDEYNSTHSLEISGYCGVPGKYTAYLSGANGNSQPTHFEVLNTDITFSGDRDTLTVTFQTASNPQYLVITDRFGGAKGIYEFTDQEKRDGVATIHPDEITMEQHGIVYEKYNYIRVIYQGNYGRVINELTQLD